MSDLSMPIRAIPGQMAEFGTDDRMIVYFFRKEELHGVQSQEAGRPIYVGVDFVHIQQPGERDYVERPVRPDDRIRFPRHWAAYQEQREPEEAGTPLGILFPRDPDIVANFAFLKIRTVEQLAALTAQAQANVGMGAVQYVQKAKEFMEAASGYSGIHKITRELETAKEENEQLKARMAALENMLSAAGETKRGPGRPRKMTEDDEQ